ncbi:MAG TPA: FAD-binding protein [Rhodoglobus sp.]|nr:FAD-binding protein [Rhodoglobus sp.]
MTLDELRAAVSGTVLEPADPGFPGELLGFNLYYVNTPDLVVGAASVDDVAAAVRYADEHDLPVTVLATGHGAHGAIAAGLVITLRRLDAVAVDPRSRTATVAGGARWAAVVEAAAHHGLAPITGSSTNVGATGFLLGGGLGPLARSHGVGSDHVRSFTVVTADGSVVVADRDSEPELFWALRGGKGGFGVVVETTIGLLDLPAVYAGSVVFGESDIDAVLRGWIDWTRTADARATTSVQLVRFPPLEQVPAPMRGRTLLMLRFAFPGSAEEGERLAAPLLALGTPEFGGLGMLPAERIAEIHQDPTEPGPGWGVGMLLNDLDGGFADVLLAHAGPSARSPFMAAEVRQLGGATAVDVPEGSAVGGRASGYALHIVGAPDPSLFETVLPAAAEAFATQVAPWASPETTINWVSGSTYEEFAKAWPAETFARLAELRRQWDPRGRFPYGPAKP